MNSLPIRARLTLWYVLLLAVTFAAFSVYLIVRFRDSLQAAINSSLEITVAKTIAAFDEEDFIETGKLTFDHIGTSSAPSDFSMRLVSAQGETWDTYGSLHPDLEAGAPTPAFSTLTGLGETPDWRVYSQPILDSNGEIIGWLQAARSLESVDQTLDDLTNQLLLGIPLILLLAGAGGYFLATRALNPIAQITDTARAITAHDLSRRLDYRGAADELGKLASAFDDMLARMQDSFERERRFTSDAAHELRTPLTVLKGQIEVTLARPRLPVEYEAKLRELAAQVERLIRLSNTLLLLARAGQNQIVFEPVDLAAVLETVIEQAQVAEKNLRVDANLPPSLIVRGDADALTRLFLNLLDNAWKYTPAGGSIRVEATQTDEGARVVIHNSGEGIAPEHLPHLFEPFYRVDSARSRETGGSGLGLAIAREIAIQHGGSVSVESQLGEGVRVMVELPK